MLVQMVHDAMRCAHCGDETTPKTAWAEHVGFSKPRRSGGVNALYGRRQTGRVLCQACGLRLSEGLLNPSAFDSEAPEQERLI